MSSIAPAPSESFFRKGLPCSVCNSARPRAARLRRHRQLPILLVDAAEERQGVFCTCTWCAATGSKGVSCAVSQLRAVVALHQCDLFRGRRPADHLARSAELFRCSVGRLSCTRRLGVDGEYRVLLTASSPRFLCKDISLRCRGCPPGRERLLRPRLRGRLPQTPDADGRSHAHDDEPFAVRHPTAGLPARSHAPGAPEDVVAGGGGHRPQSRRLGVEVRTVRRPSVSGRLPRARRGP